MIIRGTKTADFHCKFNILLFKLYFILLVKWVSSISNISSRFGFIQNTCLITSSWNVYLYMFKWSAASVTRYIAHNTHRSICGATVSNPLTAWRVSIFGGISSEAWKCSNRCVYCSELCCPVCCDVKQIWQWFTSHNAITVVIYSSTTNASMCIICHIPGHTSCAPFIHG
jgi:hypothetical protein